MSQASFDTPVAQSQHPFQSSHDNAAPNPPGNRGDNTQETWSNAAPIRNRALSVRTKTNPQPTKTRSRGFSLLSLRESVQPELSRKLFRLIKSENALINAYEAAGRERMAIATQLSEWGEQTSDEAVNDISDKIGVLLSEMGHLDEGYAAVLETSRNRLKMIRDTEKSVQPSRDGKGKIYDEIQKLKMKEPQSVKLVMLEQELVRAEAENLVAEAQLTNITRQKFKEAYETEFAALIERAEKQIILAKHGRRLLELLDDSAVSPGDTRVPYENGAQARQVLNDAEDNLKEWQPEYKAPSENGSDTSKGKEVSRPVDASG
ncbi:sphingolipid long chain base-responsive lsp1 [Trichoderma arundinaceum]|uniref:Sphingolipid long chain base-responsive lsp1 n=1 Tax=Trichoderma arundinaceum TaxID=490622 RepID=A0A395NPC1_TRIAR|nr:sphingolipid long chain base-responsive lsp1 [Trichoderma arundinaceum]